MSAAFDRLVEIMAALRNPKGGCPWDLEQNFATIAPFTIEEAYEVADAIQRRDMGALKDELGDLLLQVVYHARMAEEQGRFDADSVARAICDKMVARHPHVFGSAAVASTAAQTQAWEHMKAEERAAKAPGTEPSVLDDLPLALPALMRAEKLQKRAARVGFDWPDAAQVLAKIEEEIGELRAELAGGGSPARLADEIGDLLFACANLARHLKVDPEAALRGCNAKFDRRFRAVEQALATRSKKPQDASLAEMEALWAEAKRRERP